MKIRVIKCSSDEYWYEEEIGNIFDVATAICPVDGGMYYEILDDDEPQGYGFKIRDCEVLHKNTKNDINTVKELFLTDENGEELTISSALTQENGFNTFTVSRGTNEEGNDWEITYKISYKMEEV